MNDLRAGTGREHPPGWPPRAAACGIAAFVAAVVVAPFASLPDYVWWRHSVSELAGQGMPNAWIMRSGFVAFGTGVVAASLARLRTAPAVFAPLLLFGIGMIAAAVWSHLPILPSMGGSQAEDDLHSVAASLMGVAFAAACGARLWMTRGRDGLSALGLVVSIAIPLFMLQVPDLAGAAQRLMFLMSFVWILRAVSTPHPVRTGGS